VVGEHNVWNRLKRIKRGIHARLIYLQKPVLQFLPVFGMLVVLLIAGSFCFHHYYEQKDLSYSEALFLTYCLVFMEHIEPFPKVWFLQLFYLILPLLGLVVVLDALVRFGYYVLRRDRNNELWVRAMTNTYSDHVVLVGLGRVGLRVLQQLVSLGEDIVCLEKDAENPNIVYAQRHKIPVVIGDGRMEGILEDLNVNKAKSIILASDDDLSNLEVACDARSLQPDIRVVMRLYDQALASKIRENLGFHMAFSTAQLASPLFATCSSDRSIENAFYVGEQLMVVASIQVNEDSELVGRCVSDIGAEHEVFFLRHRRRKEETMFPSANVEFEVGDDLLVQTQPPTLKLIHRWNRDKEPY